MAFHDLQNLETGVAYGGRIRDLVHVQGQLAQSYSQAPAPLPSYILSMNCDCRDCQDNSLVAGSMSAKGNSLEFDNLPNELIFNALIFLDVSDLLAVSRVNRRLRAIARSPVLHKYRLRSDRAVVSHLLESPARSTRAQLMARNIFILPISVTCRSVMRSFMRINIERHLASRPSVESLVLRGVLPPEYLPPAPAATAGLVSVALTVEERRKAAEKQRVKARLEGWISNVWKHQVRERSKKVRRSQELQGVGRVWRLRRFWERVGRGENEKTG